MSRRKKGPELPDSLELGYTEFRVVCNPTMTADGHMSMRKKLIALDAEMTPVEKVNTIFHEVIHASCDMGHLELKEEEEERVAMVVGNAITEVLRRNPELLNYVMESLS